jgi:hypothetical protein
MATAFATNAALRSFATRLRRARFKLLLEMIGDTSNVSILDVGGTAQYWDTVVEGSGLEKRICVTLLNLERSADLSSPHLVQVIGDGRHMPQYADKAFDIVVSNSTIEHAGTLEDQRRMADEIRRVGRRYYVQTPNRYFPIEPHFLFPFFQFLPVPWRTWLVRHFQLGWIPRVPDPMAALRMVESVRLLDRSQVQSLFPDARIFEERLAGLTKSFVAYKPD